MVDRTMRTAPSIVVGQRGADAGSRDVVNRLGAGSAAKAQKRTRRVGSRGRSQVALVSAIALHAAGLAASVEFVRSTPSPASSPVELALVMETVPAIAPLLEPVAQTDPEPVAEVLSQPVTVAVAAEPTPMTVATQAPQAAPEPDEPVEPAPSATMPAHPSEKNSAPGPQPVVAVEPRPEVAGPALPESRSVVVRHPAQVVRPAVPDEHASAEAARPAHAIPSRPTGEAKPDARRGPPIQAATTAADEEALLEARVRDAVQQAVRYPAAARMMGVTGRARLLLEYRNGSVGGSALAQSSGMPVLDQAALAAARGARYPAPPPALAGLSMRFLVWVDFKAG